MHRARYTLFATFLFFVFGVPAAFANISPLPGAPTNLQPFSFFCNPYTFGFEPGKHYIPTEGGFCTYAIPLGGSVFVAVYKGVPGNSEITMSDFYGGSARVVQTFPNFFESPPNEQDFFGVVYAASLGSAFNDFLRTGAPLPAGAVEGVNYFILPWKWGPKPASEFDPVVIIPGILGSWEKNGGWIIDPILHTYDNLIDTFKANEYVSGQTLFPFPYDWRNSNTTTAKILKNKIQDIKEVCQCSHVDIVGHSMGGLVAWQYIQSDEYQNDVDQLIFLATPLSGASKAYLTWEGGEVNFGDSRQNLVMRRIFKNEARDNEFESIFEYIRGKPITSIQELLPVYTYLFDIGGSNIYPTGHPRNTFLENLRSNFTVIRRGVRVTNILAETGDGNTIFAFSVDPSDELPKWEHGKPIITFTESGDGTVPRSSIENYLGVDQEFFNTNHTDIATTSASVNYVFKILNGINASPIVSGTRGTTLSLLFVKLFSPIDMQIVAPDGKRLGKNFDTGEEFNEIPDTFYSGFNTDDEYAVIINPLPGKYTVETKGTGSGPYTIVADYIDPAGDVETEVSGNTHLAQAITHTLQLFPDTRSVSIEAQPSDTEPPVISITSPEGGKTYTRLDTVSIIVNITDESDIASTTYNLNGGPVNPAVPLPFITTPLGTSTVSVFATDSFGNTGEARTTFMLGATPESCVADMTRAFQNKWIKKKGVYNDLVEKCQKLKKLLGKDGKKTDKKIEKVLKDMEKLANGKHVTLEGRALILENVLWFREHKLK